MIARFITLMFIAALALPLATLTRPSEPALSWGSVSVEAKGKKHKKARNPQDKTATRPERQTVTRTFSNTATITIPAGPPATTKGPASLYPSGIDVNGFSNGVVTDVNVILNDFSHSFSGDNDLLLSRSDGRQALVMSDRASSNAATNIDLTLDDEAAAGLPDVDPLTSGTFRPTNVGSDDDTFAAPAPTPGGNVALSAFDGADPNGTWQLWVMDDGFGEGGDIEDGWALEITAEVDVQVPDRANDKKHKKSKQHGKKRR